MPNSDSITGRRTAPKAAAVLAATFLLGACATAGGGIAPRGPDGIIPRSADERTRLTLSNWTPPSGYACVLEAEPRQLPVATGLVDVGQLYGDIVSAWPTLGSPRGHILLSVGYNSTGRPDQFHVIESSLADSSLVRDVANLVDQRLFRQAPGEPFGVRIRVTVDSIPGVAIGRRETCYPRWADSPVIGSVERDPLADDVRLAQATRQVAFRLFADADGTVQDVYVQSRPSRTINTGELINAARQTVVDQPALLDRRPVGFWFTIREEVNASRNQMPIGRLATYDAACYGDLYWYGAASCGLGNRFGHLGYGGLGYGIGSGLGLGGFGWGGGFGFGFPIIIVAPPAPAPPQPPPPSNGDGENGEGEPRRPDLPFVPPIEVAPPALRPAPDGVTPSRTPVAPRAAAMRGTATDADVLGRRAAEQRRAIEQRSADFPTRGDARARAAAPAATPDDGIRGRSMTPRDGARSGVRPADADRRMAPTASPTSPRGRTGPAMAPGRALRPNPADQPFRDTPMRGTERGSSASSGGSGGGSAAPARSTPARSAPAPEPAPTRGTRSSPPGN